MEDSIFDRTWQGVGISSRAKPYPEDPISLAMFAYLEHGSRISSEHTVVVDDILQRHNYIALEGLDEKTARFIAKDKGREKARNLRSIVRASKLDNVNITTISQIKEMEKIQEELYGLFESDASFKYSILDTIPSQIRGRISEEKSLIRLSRYSLDEIAMALTLGGVRVSHDKQKKTDQLTSDIFNNYGIGNRPQFHYPSLGLEVTLQKRPGKIEPYSAFDPDKRLLVTDSPGTLRKKFNSSPQNAKRLALEGLGREWPTINEDEFLRRKIGPVYRRLSLLPRLGKIAAGLAFVSYLTISSSIGPGLEQQHRELGSDAIWEKYGPTIGFYADQQFGISESNQ